MGAGTEHGGRMKRLRIVIAGGPGDEIGTFRHWRAGGDDPTVTHIAFSRQIFDACQEMDAEVLLLGEASRIDRLVDGRFTIEHHGNPTTGKRGLAYHLSELRRYWQMSRAVARFDADVYICGTSPHVFALQLMRWQGVRVVVCFHCVLWHKFRAPGRAHRWLNRLNARLFGRCAALLCVSEDIKRQLRLLTGGRTAPFVAFLPWFRGATFEGIPAPLPAPATKRVMYAGRIEHDKGVFDLLTIAESLRAQGRDDVAFDLCGAGAAPG